LQASDLFCVGDRKLFWDRGIDIRNKNSILP
jgi:hypothetical protein